MKFREKKMNKKKEDYDVLVETLENLTDEQFAFLLFSLFMMSARNKQKGKKKK